VQTLACLSGSRRISFPHRVKGSGDRPCDQTESLPVLEEDNKSCCTLANGARVVSLPGDPDTLRGYSAPKLIIKDKAAYVSDAMQAALDPMLAVSKGRLIEMSSPNG